MRVCGVGGMLSDTVSQIIHQQGKWTSETRKRSHSIRQQQQQPPPNHYTRHTSWWAEFYRNELTVRLRKGNFKKIEWLFEFLSGPSAVSFLPRHAMAAWNVGWGLQTCEESAA